ncbi:hypothetical protein CMI48_03695 [Candidatus Pacearchaeota archaeon]|nr:hypothetical protein [Candidatus Pacearchaeota archaeon]
MIQSKYIATLSDGRTVHRYTGRWDKQVESMGGIMDTENFAQARSNPRSQEVMGHVCGRTQSEMRFSRGKLPLFRKRNGFHFLYPDYAVFMHDPGKGDGRQDMWSPTEPPPVCKQERKKIKTFLLKTDLSSS